jgi:hypothetical protein
VTGIATPTSSPSTWLGHIMGCLKCAAAAAHKPCYTGWISGDEKPATDGWYERLFTDGHFRHWWNGKTWSTLKDGPPHWRQIGDYPCWRGMTHRAFVLGTVT